MNGIHLNGKTQNFEKTHPGCLGRMMNLFELNIGVSSNRLLTNKPHLDGSPLSRSRSDLLRMSPACDQTGDKVTSSELNNISSNRKSNLTPMKMLIDEEMSREIDSQYSKPNLVAKLMGLDALPRQEPGSAMQRSHCRGYPRRHSDIPLSYWEKPKGFFHYIDPNEYKDVYEIWHQSQESQQKRKPCETNYEKKLALIRQKFIEVKSLSMDKKDHQSKKFKEALEILSSNKDLFLKCLQEPNSMFSQRVYDLQSIPPEIKRITVLKPSKTVDSSDCTGTANKGGEQIKRSSSIQLKRLEKSHMESFHPSTWKNFENPIHPTRIVVLKPTSGKPHVIRAVAPPQSKSPRVLQGKDFLGDAEDDENLRSREVAKLITQQIREKLGRQHRDETVISSVFSNVNAGDESSFHKSEADYVACNLSDSDVMSPVSRHSWDYVNRLGSPYTSSLCRASYSPESSVSREAKKRLSERWAIMASNGSYQQRHFRCSSSTLGEMLALSETKKATTPSEEPKNLNSFLVNEKRTGRINVDNTPMDLLRSKFVPVSTTEFGSRLNRKNGAPNEEMKTGNAKSSFKGKVSSLFFSRNKKSSKDKSPPSETKDEYDSSAGQIGSNTPETPSDSGPNSLSPGLMETSSKSPVSNFAGKTSCEAGSTLSKCNAFGHLGENQDQPSPISVLDPIFEENEYTSRVLPRYVKPDRQGANSPLNPVRSHLIDTSPPIGSLARTLSWDYSCVDTTEFLATQETSEEQEWFFLVETLLSIAGLQGELRSNSFLARWHSPESPLDPSLRDKYIDLNKEKLHVAKRRQMRSTQKLVFDCVNEALVEIAAQTSIPCVGPTIADEVWAQVKVWFSDEAKCVLDDCDDGNCLVVRNEVALGKKLFGNLRLEISNFCKEIEGELLEELINETVVEFAGGV